MKDQTVENQASEERNKDRVKGSKETPPDPSAEWADRVVFDLCYRLLGDHASTLSEYRPLRKWILRSAGRSYSKYRRSEILQRAFQRLENRVEPGRSDEIHRQIFDQNIKNPSEHLLARFDLLLNLLPPLDRIVMIGIKRHRISREDICAAFSIPLDSLDTRMNQIENTLGDWIWPNNAPPAEEIRNILNEKFERLKIHQYGVQDHSDSNDRKIGARERWLKAPWYIKSSAEGVGVALLVLGILFVVPKAREIYSNRQKQELEAFDLADLGYGVDEDGDYAQIEVESTELIEEAEEDEAIVEEPVEIADEETKNQTRNDDIRVGNSEIWRFYVKTDSPHELRPQVINQLLSLKIEETQPGLQGLEAPGGIQFNLLVPKGVVLDIKDAMENMASPFDSARQKNSLLAETFTWYKNRSRKRIPSGQARVVIWLSQI